MTEMTANAFTTGNQLLREGKLEEAIASYHKAIQLQPEMAAAYWNLAKVWQQMGKSDEAIASRQKALELNPNLGGVEFNLSQGYILAKEGKLESAIAIWQAAIKLKPDLAEAYGQIGILLRNQGKFSEAIQNLKKALEIQPDYAIAHQHLCGIIRDTNDYKTAREVVNKYYQKCQQTDPIMTWIYMISTYQVSGLNEIAKDQFFELETKLKEDIDIVKKTLELKSLYGNFLFSVPYLRDNIEANSHVYKLVAQAYTELVLKPNSNHHQQFSNFEISQSRKLKIGFISNHFCRHSVGWCSQAVIRELSQITPEVHLYITGPLKKDDITQRFEQMSVKTYWPKKYPNGFASYTEIVEQILEDKLDVVVDLDSATLPVNVHILYEKPAPVCVSWLGFDAPYISESHYFLCDWYTHPQGREKYYLEKLVRLPETSVAVGGFDSHSVDRNSTKNSLGIDSDKVVYLCVAPGRKTNPEMVRAQLKILQHNSKSILIRKGQGDVDIIYQTYLTESENLGVEFNRIMFL